MTALEMTTALAGMLAVVPRPDGVDAPDAPEPIETRRPAPYGLACAAACAPPVVALLARVAAELNRRGHETRLTDDGELYVSEQLAARVLAERVQVTAALVFDGRTHFVPVGCDTAHFSRLSHAMIAAEAIERRQSERAKSLPVPVDPTAIVRDVEEVSNAA